MAVNEADAGINTDIREGKYWGSSGAIARAKARFEASPKELGDLVVWMSTLYSGLTSIKADIALHHFPDPMRMPGRIIWCIWRLHSLVVFFTPDWYFRLVKKLRHDQCETVSSILCRWALSRLCIRRTRCMNIAYAYAQKGSTDNRSGGHVHLLSDITLARIAIWSGNWEEAEQCLERPIHYVDQVADQMQRARIYRSLAELYPIVYGDSEGSLDMAVEYAHLARVSGAGADIDKKTDARIALLKKAG